MNLFFALHPGRTAQKHTQRLRAARGCPAHAAVQMVDPAGRTPYPSTQ